MKRMLSLLTLFLVACSTPAQNQTVIGPQTLQGIQTIEPPAYTPTEATNTPTSSTDSSDRIFASQQEFIQFMADELTSLEGTLQLLDANLSEALNSDNPASLLALREFMISGVRQDQANVEALTAYNAAVVTLQGYVAQALHYNMEQKAAEFDIFSAESLQERTQLLGANATNEQNATRYLSLAWQEIHNLAETEIYRK